MGWWQWVIIGLLLISCGVSIAMGVRESTKGPGLEKMKKLKRGLDRYIIVWGCALLGGGASILLLNWWLSCWVGVGAGTLLAILGMLWFVNSSRYVRDTQKAEAQSQIDILNKYKDLDIAHATFCLSTSAAILALTMLEAMMQQ